MGSLGAAGIHGWPEDGVFRTSRVGKPVGASRDPYFTLSITFEFPLPPLERSRSEEWQNRRIAPYAFDTVDLSLRVPGEKPLPYLALINDLKPGDGVEVGDGWRVVSREYSREKIWIRFDAADWRALGGNAPRRLAAASESKARAGVWDHQLSLSPHGWGMVFHTQTLPLHQWRSRYTTAEALYDWLRTPPAQRNSSQRFVWWENAHDRPPR